MTDLFLIFITIDVLLEMVTAAGGFEALSQLLQSTFTQYSAAAVMLISSVVGGLELKLLLWQNYKLSQTCSCL